MIDINSREAKTIRERVPSAHIRRTVHRYYVEENTAVLSLLAKIRSGKDDVCEQGILSN